MLPTKGAAPVVGFSNCATLHNKNPYEIKKGMVAIVMQTTEAHIKGITFPPPTTIPTGIL